MRLPGWMLVLVALLLVVATAVCAIGSYGFARQIAVDLADSGVSVASAGFDAFLESQPTATVTIAPPTETPRPGETPLPPTITPTVGPTATIDPLAGYQWDDPRRLNVLVMGIDQRTGEEGTFRTDTMIVVSIDPVRKTVGMLSIPRDLWVDIPGYVPARINTANDLGDSGGYPGGGPALAARTVTETLGVNIDRYLRVNFDVFTEVVNLVAPNGVEVCPAEPIDDDHYPDAGYGTITVHFDAGCQSLDAVRLLQYARTRATQGSDFDRAARQQEVIKALRDTVLNAGGIVNFIGQIPALWDSLSGSYVTDLTLEEIIALGGLAQEIPRENIHSGVINNLYVDLATTAAGDQVLIPRYDAIRSLMDDVFNPQPDLGLSDLRDRATAENAEITVYNNTDTVGLAGQTRDWLIGQGVSIPAQPGNMPEADNGVTVIRDYTGKLWTARYLAALLGLSEDRIQTGTDGLTSADVMIVVGSDMPQILAAPPTG
ncbi:MAG TPA: LCP family protein [Candidatus Limnocylindrales bacterium]|nr:LCP family protein [Candidatus Limnocylindrales bacterium]